LQWVIAGEGGAEPNENLRVSSEDRRHRRRRRRAGRRRGNGRVRQLEGLGRRDPRRGMVGRLASAILIGAFAGLIPAVRASRMPPTVALRTV
jgi:hypothetical protein